MPKRPAGLGSLPNMPVIGENENTTTTKTSTSSSSGSSSRDSAPHNNQHHIDPLLLGIVGGSGGSNSNTIARHPHTNTTTSNNSSAAVTNDALLGIGIPAATVAPLTMPSPAATSASTSTSTKTTKSSSSSSSSPIPTTRPAPRKGRPVMSLGGDLMGDSNTTKNENNGSSSNSNDKSSSQQQQQQIHTSNSNSGSTGGASTGVAPLDLGLGGGIDRGNNSGTTSSSVGGRGLKNRPTRRIGPISGGLDLDLGGGAGGGGNNGGGIGGGGISGIAGGIDAGFIGGGAVVSSGNGGGGNGEQAADNKYVNSANSNAAAPGGGGADPRSPMTTTQLNVKLDSDGGHLGIKDLIVTEEGISGGGRTVMGRGDESSDTGSDDDGGSDEDENEEPQPTAVAGGSSGYDYEVERNKTEDGDYDLCDRAKWNNKSRSNSGPPSVQVTPRNKTSTLPPNSVIITTNNAQDGVHMGMGGIGGGSASASSSPTPAAARFGVNQEFGGGGGGRSKGNSVHTTPRTSPQAHPHGGGHLNTMNNNQHHTQQQSGQAEKGGGGCGGSRTPEHPVPTFNMSTGNNNMSVSANMSMSAMMELSHFGESQNTVLAAFGLSNAHHHGHGGGGGGRHHHRRVSSHGGGGGHRRIPSTSSNQSGGGAASLGGSREPSSTGISGARDRPAGNDKDSKDSKEHHHHSHGSSSSSAQYHADDFSAGPVIGTGSFGAVRVVKHKANGDFFALKKVSVRTGPDQAKALLAELQQTRLPEHPNVVTSYNAYYSQRDSFMRFLMEFCDCGAVGQVCSGARQLGRDYLARRAAIPAALTATPNRGGAISSGGSGSIADTASNKSTSINASGAFEQPLTPATPQSTIRTDRPLGNDSSSNTQNNSIATPNTATTMSTASPASTGAVASPSSTTHQSQSVAAQVQQQSPSGELTVDRLAYIALGIVSGLSHIHTVGNGVHRDIKPSNIVCTSSGHVKVADFGTAKFNATEDVHRTAVGTVAYQSPEQVDPQVRSYTSKVDVWALGLTVAELWIGHFPFGRELQNTRTPFEMLRILLHDSKLPSEFIAWPEAGGGGDGGDRVPPQDLKDFVAACLDRQERRPTAQALLNAFRQRQQQLLVQQYQAAVGSPSSTTTSVITEREPSSSGSRLSASGSSILMPDMVTPLSTAGTGAGAGAAAADGSTTTVPSAESNVDKAVTFLLRALQCTPKNMGRWFQQGCLRDMEYKGQKARERMVREQSLKLIPVYQSIWQRQRSGSNSSGSSSSSSGSGGGYSAPSSSSSDRSKEPPTKN